MRAAVLGANDGIVSTASLIAGMAASDATRGNVILAGIAGLAAGALSMAAGEYVSVSSQADTESADLNRERKELETDIESERKELAAIYVSRGLKPELARQVADQLMARDALGAHARDELGISAQSVARPVQAAVFSAIAFSAGAVMPLGIALAVPRVDMVSHVSGISLVFLGILGAIAALTGGAPILKGIARVVFWGALAMGLTTAIGALFGTAV